MPARLQLRGSDWQPQHKGDAYMTTNAQVPAKLYFEDVQVGDAIPTLVKGPVTHLQLVRYAGASGDFNPLHTDPKIGEALGIGASIAHGMRIMGFVRRMLSDYVRAPPLRKFGARLSARSPP